MPWSPLSTRFAGLPLVLAGPILRKTTRTSVTVWLALKESAHVTLAVYDSDVPINEASLTGSGDTTKLGPHLHMIAITAVGGTLDRGHVYSYQLAFSATSLGNQSMEQAVGTTAISKLGYGSRRSPSFSLPTLELDELRLVLGSCRIPQATGPDAMTMLDGLIEASADNAIGRPHQLLLTGDQIYADDVAVPMLAMISDASRQLMGDEPLPGLPLGQLAESLLPGEREPYIKGAGFTTPDRAGHLMSLGEYLAMYFFMWSPALWGDVPTLDELEELEPAMIFTVKDSPKKIEAHRTRIVDLRDGLGKVRRALANVPTYMIFDDHEVSDDWNMHRAFCNGVYGSDLGLRIVQNALVAYALCQHWGNAPEQFGVFGAGAELLSLLRNANRYADVAGHPDIAQIVGIKPAAQIPNNPYSLGHENGIRTLLPDGAWIDTQTLIYNFTVEGDAHQIIFTDTRTWRSNLRGTIGPADLLSAAQLAVQIGGAPPLNGRQSIVVVTTNLIPSTAIRQAMRDIAYKAEDGYENEDLFDEWDIRRVDFARTIAALSRRFSPSAGLHSGSVLVLSGDVHASQASRTAYWATSQVDDLAGQPSQVAMTVAHLVCSSLKKEGANSLGQHKSGYEYVPPGFFAKMVKQPVLLTESFIGWNAQVATDGAPIGRYRVSTRMMGDGTGTYVYWDGWPTATLRKEEIPELWAKQLIEIFTLPAHRFRIDYLRAATGGTYATEAPVIDVPDELERWAQGSRAYERTYGGGGRDIVGTNNLGEIKFYREPTTIGPRLTARFTSRWRDGDDVAWVRFDVSLDVNDLAYPEIPYNTIVTTP